MSPNFLDKFEHTVKKVLPHGHGSSQDKDQGSGRSSPAPRSPLPATPAASRSQSGSFLKCKSSTPSSSQTSVPATVGKEAQQGRPAGPPSPRPVEVPAPAVTQSLEGDDGKQHNDTALNHLVGAARNATQKLTPNFLHGNSDCHAGGGSVPCSQLFGIFKAIASDDKDEEDTDSEADEPAQPRRKSHERPSRASQLSQDSTASILSSGHTTEDTGDTEFEPLHRSESEPAFLPDEMPQEDTPNDFVLKRHASVSTSTPGENMAHFDQNDPHVLRWLRDTLGPVQLSQVAQHPPMKAPAARQERQPRPRQLKRRPTDVPEGDEEDDGENVIIRKPSKDDPTLPPQTIMQNLAIGELQEGDQLDDQEQKVVGECKEHPRGAGLPTDTNPQELARFRRAEVPDSEKLRVIRAEFGDIASMMVNEDGVSEPERILAESQGSLFRGIMMLGNLHLTTHRLVFHALIPPDNMMTRAPDFESVDDNEAAAMKERPSVVQAGSVTLHQEGIFASKKRVWMEITPEMLTCYPSADEAGKVRPLFSILSESRAMVTSADQQSPRSTASGRRTLGSLSSSTSPMMVRAAFGLCTSPWTTRSPLSAGGETLKPSCSVARRSDSARATAATSSSRASSRRRRPTLIKTTRTAGRCSAASCRSIRLS